MDALQCATAAFALAELARQTALLVWKLCKAGKDARGLHDKTQNLAHLIKTIGHYLEKRQEQPGGRVITSEHGSTEESITASLDLCKACLDSIYEKLNLLLDPSQSRLQIISRIKFVFNRDYIASREQDIMMHLSTLSIWLQFLWHEEHISERQQDAIHNRNVEQAMQHQQQMHENFIRQLFALLAYVFQRTAAASGSRANSSMTTVSARSVAIGPRELLAIANDDGQTLEDLFGSPFDRDISLNAFSFGGLRVEEVVDDGSALVPQRGVGPEEQVVILEDDIEQDDSSLEQTRSIDMVQYASETTFLLAIKSNSIELVSNLISDGADTTWKDSHDWTLLHHAVFRSHQEIVSMLLALPKCSESQYLESQTRTGETALIFAAQRIHKLEGFNIAMELLNLECGVNISDDKGSALYYAVNEGRPTHPPRQHVVQTMMEKGAELSPVYNKIPGKVNDYEVLSEYVKVMKSEVETSKNPEPRRDSKASVGGRRDSTTTQRRQSFLVRIKSGFSRRDSSSGGMTGTTPPT